MGWQPIEAAPKDARRVLLFGSNPEIGSGHVVITAYWDDDQESEHCHGWHVIPWDTGLEEALGETDVVYTHWMPLPPPPATDE
jgi:hypothetical protein